MTGPRLPEKGERITIRWPGGPYDFVMIYEDVAAGYPSGWEGFAFLRGEIVEPELDVWRGWGILYARATGEPGEYEMVGNRTTR